MLRLIVLAASVLFAGLASAQDFELPEPAAEHEFLKRFVGEWTTESEMFPGDGSSISAKGTLTGRMIGEFWAVLEVKGEVFGQPFTGLSTIGFDGSRTKKYVGTRTDSMTDFMWQYQGEVDSDKLSLHSQGPDPSQSGKMLKAVDTWEFVGDDKLILTGQMEMTEGEMTTMVKVTCTRRK